MHDRHRAEPVGCRQYDPGTPDVLLRAVTVRHDGFKLVTLSSRYFGDDPGAHHTVWYAAASQALFIPRLDLWQNSSFAPCLRFMAFSQPGIIDRRTSFSGVWGCRSTS